MGLAELRADARLHRERLLKVNWNTMATADVVKVIKTELAENIWPFLHELFGAIDEELAEPIADLGEAIDEMIEREESSIHADLAAMIIGVFEHGKLMANELEKLLPAADEVTRKRLGEMIHAYRQGATIVTERVVEVTIEIDDEGGDGSSDESGDEQPPAEEPDAEEAADESGEG